MYQEPSHFLEQELCIRLAPRYNHLGSSIRVGLRSGEKEMSQEATTVVQSTVDEGLR